MEEWRQFHCDLNDLTQWITEAEELLTDTFAPDGGLARDRGMGQEVTEIMGGGAGSWGAQPF